MAYFLWVNGKGSFVWDPQKELQNVARHGVSFTLAAKAFKDPNIKILTDSKHSDQEERYFCMGKVEGKILTVRFTYRNGKIRIFGAGYWRKGRALYEKKVD